jgi:signal transduction histidine kinase
VIRSVEARVAGFVAAGTLAALFAFAWVMGSLAETAARQSVEARVETLAGELSNGLDLAADGTLEIIRPVEEPAFERPRSGWYWVARRGHVVIGQSRSLAGQPAGAVTTPATESLSGQPLVRRTRILVRAPEASVTVAGSLDGIREDVARTRRTVAIISALLGLVLVTGTTLLIRHALRPLRDMTKAIEDLREGRTEAVPAPGIANLDPVAAAVNRLSGTLRHMAERGLQDAENLAHAIKTPLSVITLRSAPSGPAADPGVSTAAERIARQVDSRLRRVRAARGGGVMQVSAALGDSLSDAAFVASRAHGRGLIRAHIAGAERLRVAASREQLDESVGAVVDNAFRHAKSLVEIEARRVADRVILTIVDDGPGIPEERLRSVRERGRRLDERPDGDGLGLAIAEEILGDIGGVIVLENRPHPSSGLEVRLDMPAA